MVRTTIIPDSKTVSISVPEDYIGKVLEIIAFAKDEGLNVEGNTKKVTSFTVLHTNIKDFKFSREEANER